MMQSSHAEQPGVRGFRVMRRFSLVAGAFLCLVAVAGPGLLAMLTALYTGRPSPLFLVTGLMIAVAILACDGWIIARRHWITGGLALATQILVTVAEHRFIDKGGWVTVTAPEH